VGKRLKVRVLGMILSPKFKRFMIEAVLIIGCFLTLAMVVYFIDKQMEKAAKKLALNEKQLEEAKEKEAFEKQNALEERRRKIREKIDNVGLIEQASIAQKVIESFPIADFQKLRPMLNFEDEIKKAVQEFNSKLGSQYEEMLLVEFGGEEPLPIRSDYEPLLKKIMDIGYRAVLKEYSLLDSSSHGDVGGQTSREISDSGTWDDIKGRI
jgi:hypothetical protein